jgi:hypothetical protein
MPLIKMSQFKTLVAIFAIFTSEIQTNAYSRHKDFLILSWAFYPLYLVYGRTGRGYGYYQIPNGRD